MFSILMSLNYPGIQFLISTGLSRDMPQAPETAPQPITGISYQAMKPVCKPPGQKLKSRGLSQIIQKAFDCPKIPYFRFKD
jgi:hypothetical protein